MQCVVMLNCNTAVMWIYTTGQTGGVNWTSPIQSSEGSLIDCPCTRTDSSINLYYMFKIYVNVSVTSIELKDFKLEFCQSTFLCTR